MFEHAHHFIGGGRHPCDGHDAVPIDFQHLVGAVVHDHVAGRRPAIACDQHSVAILQGQNRRGSRNLHPSRSSDRIAELIPLLLQKLKKVPLHPHCSTPSFLLVRLIIPGWTPKSGFTARVQRGPSQAARCASTYPDSVASLIPLSVVGTVPPVWDRPSASASINCPSRESRCPAVEALHLPPTGQAASAWDRPVLHDVPASSYIASSGILSSLPRSQGIGGGNRRFEQRSTGLYRFRLEEIAHLKRPSSEPACKLYPLPLHAGNLFRELSDTQPT